jgi:protein phosphatase
MDIKTLIFEEGDMLLLCSDGLTNKVNQEEISGILAQDCTLNEKASELIELANQNGGEDNITLAIVAYLDASEGR